MSALLEKHYTVAELARCWGFAESTVRKMFRNEPGVLVVAHPEKLRKRPYTSIRIPQTVAIRVYERLSKGKATRNRWSGGSER
jgi:predicted transcriptional regulator